MYWYDIYLRKFSTMRILFDLLERTRKLTVTLVSFIMCPSQLLFWIWVKKLDIYHWSLTMKVKWVLPLLAVCRHCLFDMINELITAHVQNTDGLLALKRWPVTPVQYCGGFLCCKFVAQADRAQTRFVMYLVPAHDCVFQRAELMINCWRLERLLPDLVEFLASQIMQIACLISSSHNTEIPK